MGFLFWVRNLGFAGGQAVGIFTPVVVVAVKAAAQTVAAIDPSTQTLTAIDPAAQTVTSVDPAAEQIQAIDPATPSGQTKI